MTTGAGMLALPQFEIFNQRSLMTNNAPSLFSSNRGPSEQRSLENTLEHFFSTRPTTKQPTVPGTAGGQGIQPMIQFISNTYNMTNSQLGATSLPETSVSQGPSARSKTVVKTFKRPRMTLPVKKPVFPSNVRRSKSPITASEGIESWKNNKSGRGSHMSGNLSFRVQPNINDYVTK